MDEKEDPKVDTPAKLQEWIDNSEKFRKEATEKIEALEQKVDEKEAEIERMKADIKADLTIIKKTDWAQDESQAGRDYRFGKFFQALQRRDAKALAEMGAYPVKVTQGGKDIKVDKEWPMRTREKADLGTPLTADSSGTDWQYAIPAYIYAETVLRTLEEASEVIPQLTKVPMSGRLIRWPVQGSTVFEFTYVTNEVTDKTEQNPTLTYVDLECETFAGWVGVTDELMEDTMIDIGGLLRVQALDDLQYTIEEQALNGSGSPFTGGLQDSSVNTSYLSGGSSFTDVTWDDLRTAISQLTTKKKRRGASWVMHPTVFDDLMSKQDGTGRFYWDPQNQPRRSIWGYPVLLSDAMPSSSAASTAFILFGNLKYIFHGTRMGLEVKYFTETMYAVQDDENFFRIRTRFADKVAIPGNFVAVTTNAS